MFVEKSRHAAAFEKKKKKRKDLILSFIEKEFYDNVYKINQLQKLHFWSFWFCHHHERVPERQQVVGGVKKRFVLRCSKDRQGNQLITHTAVVCCNYLPVVSRKMLQFETKLPQHTFPSIPHNCFQHDSQIWAWQDCHTEMLEPVDQRKPVSAAGWFHLPPVTLRTDNDRRDF